MTPRQFHALAERHRWGQERNELLFAQLAAAVHNTGFRTTEKPLEIQEFMPSRWGLLARKRRKRMSRKAVADGVRSAMGAFMRQ
jgi:hypothetical protein